MGVGEEKDVFRDCGFECVPQGVGGDRRQHRADRGAAAGGGHQYRNLFARQPALARLAAAAARLALQGPLPLAALQHIRLVRLDNPLEFLRRHRHSLEKPVTPAERRPHRHAATLGRGPHRLPRRRRVAERQLPVLAVQPRQRRARHRIERPTAPLAPVASQFPGPTSRHRPGRVATRTTPLLVNAMLHSRNRRRPRRPPRQNRQRFRTLRRRQLVNPRQLFLKPTPLHPANLLEPQPIIQYPHTNQ